MPTMKRELAVWGGIALVFVLGLSAVYAATIATPPRPSLAERCAGDPHESACIAHELAVDAWDGRSEPRSCPVGRDGANAVAPEDHLCYIREYAPPKWWHGPGTTQPPIDPNEP